MQMLLCMQAKLIKDNQRREALLQLDLQVAKVSQS